MIKMPEVAILKFQTLPITALSLKKNIIATGMGNMIENRYGTPITPIGDVTTVVIR
jgi:hypothetical protein